MARAHFVKKARKDNPVVKAGESYWWWQFLHGSKQYSATRPKPSQLTQGRWGEVYAVEEDFQVEIAGAGSTDDLQSAVESAGERLNEIADEFEEGLQNMPEQLQEGDTGQRIQERVDALREAADLFEQYEFLEPEDVKDECDDDETPIDAAFRVNQNNIESQLEFPSDPF